jgi:hypothetical protein
VTLLRHAAREDANRAEIVDALKACGWEVIRLKAPADLLLTKPGRGLKLAEVKTGPKAKFTKAQLAVMARGFEILRLETVADVLRLSRVEA